MAADASIFQQYLKPARSVADYQGDMDKQEQNALTLAAARQSSADDQATRQAYIGSGGEQNKMLQLLQQGGQYKAAEALRKSMLETQKTQGDIGLTKAKTAESTQKTDSGSYEMQVKKHDKAITDIAALQDPQTAHASIDAHLAAGDIDATKAQAMHASIPQDPAQFSTWQIGMLRGIMTAKDQLAQVSPDANARLNAQTSTANNAATVGATIRGQNMTAGTASNRLAYDKSQAEGGGTEGVSPDAIKNAAARYNIDGTLPPMGMGKQAAAGRTAILNEAALQAGASGVSPDDQRIAQIGNKANSAALAKIQQQQTMVGAFEKNFNRNADIALEYSTKVDRTGVPLANKWINAGKRSIAGDPELAAFDASVKAVSNEYAKIVSGSMGNTATAEGEIKKIEGLLNAAQTPQQVSAVINLMKRETQNRMTGFDEEKAALRSTMTTNKKPPSGATTPANIQSLLNKYK
jgi:hypothetical protein